MIGYPWGEQVLAVSRELTLRAAGQRIKEMGIE
jgi:hypothetical protein